MATPQLLSDVIVVLPGIMGSTLAHQDRLVWAPSAGAVLRAIRTFGRSISDLRLPPGIGDDHPGDSVEPVALMPDLHALPGVWTWHTGYSALLDWLQTRFHVVEPDAQHPERIPNLLPVPYDWRLSNRYNGRRLKTIVEPALERWRKQGGPAADARLVFICHSMGGLVARWYIEKEGGAAYTRKLVTLGTPHRGALTALDYLANGVSPSLGGISHGLTDFARSLPSMHQVLPEYACIESQGGLLKTTETLVPHLDARMVADGMLFHNELDGAASTTGPARYRIHPIVGSRQATPTTARIASGVVEPLTTIDDQELGGDGTVPRLSAAPKGVPGDDPIIRTVADQHGSLQSNRAVWDELEGVLTGSPTIYRATGLIEISVRAKPVVAAGEDVLIEASVASGERRALVARACDESGAEVDTLYLRAEDGVQRGRLSGLRPGAYRVVVGGIDPANLGIASVTTTVLVWKDEA